MNPHRTLCCTLLALACLPASFAQDAPCTVEIHVIQAVVAWLPKEKILAHADMFNTFHPHPILVAPSADQ